jgi:hypothetical protein
MYSAAGKPPLAQAWQTAQAQGVLSQQQKIEGRIAGDVGLVPPANTATGYI